MLHCAETTAIKPQYMIIASRLGDI